MILLVRITAILGALLLASGCGISLQNAPVGTDVDGPSYEIVAEFDDITGMERGGRVQLGPATVGRVAGMVVEDYTARVTLRIRQDIDLPVGTEAEVALTTALGDPFIALSVPEEHDGELLDHGDTIAEEHTERGVEVEDSLALLANLLNNSGIQQARTIITETNTMLEGREGTARDLLDRTEEVLASLDERSDEFNQTLAALNTLGETVADNTELLSEALTEIRPAVDVLVDQQDEFDSLLGNVEELARDVQGAVDATEEHLVNQLLKLDPVLDEFTAIDEDVQSLLDGIQEFAPLFSRALPGDYLNLDASLHVPDTVGGLLAGLDDLLPFDSGGLDSGELGSEGTADGGGGNGNPGNSQGTAGLEENLDALLEEEE